MNQSPKSVTLKTVKLKPTKNAQTAAKEPQEAEKKRKIVSAGKPGADNTVVKKPKASAPEYGLMDKAASLFVQQEKAFAVREPEEKNMSEPDLITEENVVPSPKARKEKPVTKQVTEEKTIFDTDLTTEDNVVSVPKPRKEKPKSKREEITVSESEMTDEDDVDTAPKPRRKEKPEKKPVREETVFFAPQLVTEENQDTDDNSLYAVESGMDDIAAKQPRVRRVRGRMPMWLMVAIDVLVAACVLVVFSYFHHGRPQADDTEVVVIARPTATPTPQPDNLDEADELEALPEEGEPTWAQKYAAHFTDTVVATDTSYSSPNVAITITPMTKGEGSGLVTYYVADIYVADIESFQTYFAKETFGTGFRQHVLDMDIASGALLAMSGDYYGNSRSSSHGVVIRNGMLYRADDTRNDVCVLYYDGTLETYQRGEFDAEQAVARSAWQAWTFGPSLLDENGKAKTQFNIGSVLQSENPRGGIGYYEPGHYVFVLVDGRDRGYSAGMTMEDFALVFEELGCSVAYNLDGGASAVMSYNDQVVNQPVGGGRTISDCLIIVEVE